MKPTELLWALLILRHVASFAPNLLTFSGRAMKTRTCLFSKPSIPNTAQTRDKQAISGIKSALSLPSPTLIECEFPPLVELNKLGDGSLRSSLQAEDANIAFTNKLVKDIGIPLFGPKVSSV